LAEHQNLRILTIDGEVIFPGTYEYASGMTIGDLILQAGGLTDAASTTKIDVSRRIYDPEADCANMELAKTFSFSLKKDFSTSDDISFKLEPYDIVQVRKSPVYQDPIRVRVEGEVAFEGRYTMETKNQRLSDVIKAAGGVTPDAYTKGARLERLLNDDERARRSFLLKQLKSQAEESDSVDMNKLDLGDTYTVGIYLDKALENPGSEFDIILREGDRIVVPEYNGTVKISGNVMYPNTVVYSPGKNYKYYINQAGGYGNRAKKSKTWIIYPNGTMAQVGHGAKIEPGCEIVVPTKQKPDPAKAQQWISIAQSVFSMSAMIAILIKQL
jgi:protein involved in polysaccharide export with SLBB domain